MFIIIGRDALVRAQATPLLVRALSTRSPRGGRELDQWMHAITALHEFATSTEHHEHIRSQPGAIDALLAAAAGERLPLGEQSDASKHVWYSSLDMSTRYIAADAALALGAMWDVERLLWCAIEKSDPTVCKTALLPPVEVRRVMRFVMLGGRD